ncbi:MAG: cysteine peptidase family C39 domain-containing protein, partial [Desulfuromonadaceae bacterium]|nr:cysteine peptidase family C39 domain-containing protein [Desulfuromonadaceae bacterium]
MDKYMLKQSRQNSCGIAVSKMVLALFHKNIKFLRLKLDYIPDDFLKIKQLCAKYDLELEGRKVAVKDNFYHLKGPLIVQTNIDNKTHFLLIKRKKKYFIVNDPAYGTYKVKIKQLLEELTGYYLAIISPKSRGYKLKETELNAVPIKKASLAGFIVFHLLSLLCLFLTFIIFNQVEVLHLSIILAACSFIFYILSRHFLFQLSQNYDSTMTPILMNISNQRFLDSFNKIHTLKTALVSPFVSLFSATLTVLLILVLFTINDYKLTLLAIILAVTMKIFQSLSLRDNFKYKQFDTLLLQTSKATDEKTKKINEINAKSQSLIQKKLIGEILIDICIFFAIYLVMLVNSLASLNYVLLYLFIFLYLK